MSWLRLLFALPLLLCFAACGARQAAPAHASIEWPESLDHASTPATHREAALFVLDTAKTADIMTAMIDVSLDAQLRQKPMLKPYEHVLRDFLSHYLSYDSIRDELAQAYVQRFSELQLRQIAAFYKTATGQLAVKLLPELAAIGAQLGREHVEKHQTELLDMLRKAQHDEAPKP